MTCSASAAHDRRKRRAETPTNRLIESPFFLEISPDLAPRERQCGPDQIEHYRNFALVPRSVEHDDVPGNQAQSRDRMDLGPALRDGIRRQGRRQRGVKASL